METPELAKAIEAAFAAGDIDAVAGHLSDDFQFIGPTPEPVGKAQYIGLTKTMAAAFPDINYNARTVSAEGDVIKTTSQLTGTHTEDLDLTPMGMGVIPATGKSFSNPTEEGEMKVEGGKVVSWAIERTEGGGLVGILAQLGVKPPAG
jgi:predicted ester cyclase